MSARVFLVFGLAAIVSCACGSGTDERVAQAQFVVQTGVPYDGLVTEPLTTEAPVSDTGLSCQLALVAKDGDGFEVEVTLRNGGTKSFELRHDHTAIGRNLVVELFDTDGRLLVRFDRLTWHSPFESDPERWPVLIIEAGGSKSEKLHIGQEWNQSGDLALGTYQLRVAFPFEAGRLWPSNTVEIVVDPR